MSRLRASLVYLLYIIFFLGVFDLVLIAVDVLPPHRRYGNPTLGFPELGHLGTPFTYPSGHWRFIGNDSGIVERNERGARSFRSIADITAHPPPILIAVAGDSQTDLPYRNALTHAMVLERELRRLGIDGVEVINCGQGAYSPLQAYLFFKERLSDLHPDVFILNLYTGNDFFDLLRIDDRPHFVPEGRGYRIHPPEWYNFADPGGQNSWMQRSRILYAIEEGARRMGIWRLVGRVAYLTAMARENGGGLSDALAYMRDLSRTEEPSLAYPPAYAAQMLNQYLFFRAFPRAREESLRRVGCLLDLIRNENPGVQCVLSPLPSALLVGALDRDSVFLAGLAHTGTDISAVQSMESALFDSLEVLSRIHRWMWVDNRKVFRNASARSSVFMTEDYHLSPEGSRMIGVNESAFITESCLAVPTTGQSGGLSGR